jgi:hypothetical protein
MKENKPGIDGKKFQLKLQHKMYADTIIPEGYEWKVEVLSEPEPYTKENKSKWKLINWWRKLVGTYYESGYKYTVKVLTDENS